MGRPFRSHSWQGSANEWSENALPLLIDAKPLETFIPQRGFFSCPPKGVTEGCYGGSTFCVYVCSRIDNSVL